MATKARRHEEIAALVVGQAQQPARHSYVSREGMVSSGSEWCATSVDGRCAPTAAFGRFINSRAAREFRRHEEIAALVVGQAQQPARHSYVSREGMVSSGSEWCATSVDGRCAPTAAFGRFINSRAAREFRRHEVAARHAVFSNRYSEVAWRELVANSATLQRRTIICFVAKIFTIDCCAAAACRALTTTNVISFAAASSCLGVFVANLSVSALTLLPKI